MLQRLKNLWKLSEYSPKGEANVITLTKNVTTMEKKLATIIKEKEEDIFNDEGNPA